MGKYTTQNFKDFQSNTLSEAEKANFGNDPIFWSEYQEYLRWKIAGRVLVREARENIKQPLEASGKSLFRINKKTFTLAAAVLVFAIGLWWINFEPIKSNGGGKLMGGDTTTTKIHQDSTKNDTLRIKK